MNKTAIYIPSYQNRYDEIFNYVNELSKDYDIFIVLSEDDTKLKNYAEKFDFNDSIKLVLTDCKTIGEKRQFIMTDAYKHEYKYVIQLDDDIRNYGYRITEATKRTTSDSYRREKISLKELLDTLINKIEEINCSYISPMFPFSLGFSKPGKLNINKNLNFGQCTVFNVKDFNDLGLVYDSRKNVHEDIDIIIQLLQNGKTCVTLGDYGFEVVPNSSNLSSSVVAGTSALDLCRISLYLKYRDGITLRIGKRGELRLTCKLDKYWNTKEIPIKKDKYHQDIYQLCLDGDIEKLKDYIRNNK